MNKRTFQVVEALRSGQIGVMPTDTIYGITALAFSKQAVQKIYEIKGRSENKPFIILIADLKDLELFGIRLSNREKALLRKFWPGKISVVLDCPQEKLHYLHRGMKSLAFRLPHKKELIEIIKMTGPLVSTSVNPAGMPFAQDIQEARRYFGSKLKFYLGEKKMSGNPSSVVSLKGGKIKILRKGGWSIYWKKLRTFF